MARTKEDTYAAEVEEAGLESHGMRDSSSGEASKQAEGGGAVVDDSHGAGAESTAATSTPAADPSPEGGGAFEASHVAVDTNDVASPDESLRPRGTQGTSAPEETDAAGSGSSSGGDLQKDVGGGGGHAAGGVTGTGQRAAVQQPLVQQEQASTTMAARTMVPDKEDDEMDRGAAHSHVLKNYASRDSGAVMLENSPGSKGMNNLLVDSRDKYAISPCEEKQWAVLGLSEDIMVRTIKIISHEKYSSLVKVFQVLASQTYPVNEWLDLGTFTAKFNQGEQTFDVPQPAFARYLKFKFISHYGDEFYCTVSQVKVHGSTMLESFQDEWQQSSAEVREVQDFVMNKKGENKAAAAAASTNAANGGGATAAASGPSSSTNNGGSGSGGALSPPTPAEVAAHSQESHFDGTPSSSSEAGVEHRPHAATAATVPRGGGIGGGGAAELTVEDIVRGVPVEMVVPAATCSGPTGMDGVCRGEMLAETVGGNVAAASTGEGTTLATEISTLGSGISSQHDVASVNGGNGLTNFDVGDVVGTEGRHIRDGDDPTDKQQWDTGRNAASVREAASSGEGSQGSATIPADGQQGDPKLGAHFASEGTSGRGDHQGGDAVAGGVDSTGELGANVESGAHEGYAGEGGTGPSQSGDGEPPPRKGIIHSTMDAISKVVNRSDGKKRREDDGSSEGDNAASAVASSPSPTSSDEGTVSRLEDALESPPSGPDSGAEEGIQSVSGDTAGPRGGEETIGDLGHLYSDRARTSQHAAEPGMASAAGTSHVVSGGAPSERGSCGGGGASPLNTITGHVGTSERGSSSFDTPERQRASGITASARDMAPEAVGASGPRNGDNGSGAAAISNGNSAELPGRPVELGDVSESVLTGIFPGDSGIATAAGGAVESTDSASELAQTRDGSGREATSGSQDAVGVHVDQDGDNGATTGGGRRPAAPELLDREVKQQSQSVLPDNAAGVQSEFPQRLATSAEMREAAPVTSTGSASSTQGMQISDAEQQLMRLAEDANAAASAALAASCLDRLSFSEFQDEVLARTQQAQQSAGGAVAIGGQYESIFKTLMNKIKTLEINQSLFSLYVDEVHGCYQEVIGQMLSEQERARASRSQLLSAQSSNFMKIGEQWPAFQELQAKVTEVENRMLLSSMAWFTSLLCLVIVVSNCCIKTCRTCSRIGRRGKGVGLAGPAAVGRTDDRRRKVLNHSVAHAESRVCPPGRAVEDSGMIGRGGAPGGLVDCPCYYRGDGSLYHEEPHGGGAWTGAEDVGRNVGGGYCAGKHAR